MSKSLHARKSIAKITALPNCTNMAGGGGFMGSSVSGRLPHSSSRYGKRKECVKCQFGLGGLAPFPYQNSRLIAPGSFIMRNSQFSASSARRTKLVKDEKCTNS